jgi:hypothetical protein
VQRAAELMRSVEGMRWVDEDGDEDVVELLSPPSAAEIARLESTLGFPLPSEARELLRVGRGFHGGPLEAVDFTGLPAGATLEDAFPLAIPIAHDGSGNFWIVEPSPASDAWGPIYFLCHDPPVVIFQCPDTATFIEGFLELAHRPGEGPLHFVPEDAAMRVWRGDETALERDAAMATDDPVLRDYAASLGPEFLIADFRDPVTGDGFSLRDAEGIQRHRTERIFAFTRRRAERPPRAVTRRLLSLLARFRRG